MGDTTNLLKQSYTLIQQATQYDRAGDASEALRLYLTGLEGFMSALKIEKNERIKDTLKIKMNEYLNRCEELKEIQRKRQQLPSLSQPPSCDTCVTTPTLIQPQPLSLPSTPTAPLIKKQQSPIQQQQQQSNTADLDLLLPSVPKFDPHILPQPSAPITPYVPNPVPNHNTSKLQAQLVISKKIANNAIGHSYDSLFGEFLINGSNFIIEDPYIRSKHQIDNFIRLVELIIKKTCKFNNSNTILSPSPISISLTTTSESTTQEEELKYSFKELKDNLSPLNIHFTFNFSKTLHDRSIQVNNGYKIKLGRGLDIYQKPTSKLSIGIFDLDLRPCHETSIDVIHSNQ